MKTLAEFKRNASSGKMSLKLFERYGSTDIPDRFQGIRKVVRTNTVAAILINQDGKESELRFGSAKLFEYDGNTLTIYQPGYRDLTTQEQSILDKWQIIENEYIKQYPYSNTYWKKKDYFAKCSCPWMSGFDMVKSKQYQYNGKVRDNAIKGDPILRYHVYIEE